MDEEPDWASSDKLFTKLVTIEDGKIEEQRNCFHVDFANKVLGGGVLQKGCVQVSLYC